MSRPRTAYGPNPPGRLASTMIKVLAAESSDQGRLSRGKRYWADHAVIDIVIGHGAVTAEVQGSRAEPYIVTLEASPGEGVPSKRELWIACTCPDDSDIGADACKHGVAAMFALANEVAIEPTVLDRWRRGTRAPRVTQLPATPRHDDQHESPDADVIDLRPRRDPDLDAIGALLGAPQGASAPVFPDPTPLDHGRIADTRLADILADALDHLAIQWE